MTRSYAVFSFRNNESSTNRKNIMLTTIKNKLVILAMIGVMAVLSGCAGISPNRVPSQITGTADFAYKLAKNDSGVLYGAVWNSPLNHDVTTVKFACDAIYNSDERCSHPDDYMVGKIVTKSQFSGGMVTLILMEKDKFIAPCGDFRTNRTCTFVKVQYEPHKLGTVLEIVASPKDSEDEKCYWHLGTIGGIICPDWNSAKEVRSFKAVDFALTGVEGD